MLKTTSFQLFVENLLRRETGLELRTEATERDSRLPCARGAKKRHQFLLCTPAHTASAQILCISPSVTPLNPLGVTAPSSEGAEAATAAKPQNYLCAAPHQNVRARRALLRFSCAAGTLHLRLKPQKSVRFCGRLRKNKFICKYRVYFIPQLC